MVSVMVKDGSDGWITGPSSDTAQGNRPTPSLLINGWMAGGEHGADFVPPGCTVWSKNPLRNAPAHRGQGNPCRGLRQLCYALA